MTGQKNIFLFAFFFVLFGVQKLGHALAVAGARLCAFAVRAAHAVWHAITAFFSSLIDVVTHGRAPNEELQKRNVEYLGYVGFMSWATSIALYILTAGPLGRYVGWYWTTRIEPWARGYK